MRVTVGLSGLTLPRAVAIVKFILGKRDPLHRIRPLGCSKPAFRAGKIIHEDSSQQSVLKTGSLSLFK